MTACSPTIIIDNRTLRYTTYGEELETDFVNALMPVVRKWVERGTSISDLQIIVSAAINNMLLAEEICKDL
jgi:hypothetical protein